MRKAFSSYQHCDMLLCNSLKETGYLFCYPHAGLRCLQLSSQKSKIIPFSKAAPLFTCLGDKEEAKCGNHSCTAILGHEARLALFAARARVCFQMLGYLGVASWRHFLPHVHSWVNATIVFVPGQQGKQD